MLLVYIFAVIGAVGCYFGSWWWLMNRDLETAERIFLTFLYGIGLVVGAVLGLWYLYSHLPQSGEWCNS